MIADGTYKEIFREYFREIPRPPEFGG